MPHLEIEIDRPFKSGDARLFWRMLKFALPYRRDAFLGLTFLLVVSASEALGPYLVKLAIDGPIVHSDLQGLAHLAIIYLLIMVGGYWASVHQSVRMEIIGQKVMADMRSQLFSHLQKMTASFFDANPSGRLMTRVIGDVDAIQELFTSGFVTVLGNGLTLASTAAAMLLLDWKLALLPLGLMPVVLGAAVVYKNYARAAYRLIRSALSRMNGYMAENVNGMATVHLNNSAELNFIKFKEMNEGYKRELLKSIRYNALFYPLVQFSSALSIALVLGFGGERMVFRGLGVGVVVAFVQYVQQFFNPVRNMAEKYNVFQSALASSERIFQLLDRKPDALDPKRPVTLQAVRGDVKFERVHFSYSSGRPVLTDVSFHIRSGECIAIIGTTGAGKTTLSNILLRFYPLEQGRVLLDDVDIKDLARSDLRRNIVLIPQEIFLFQGTIAQNISLDRPGVTDEKIKQAVELAGATAYFQRFPLGLGQPVGERGALLSTGERQLVAFIRALILDPPVLLLDEATSSIDMEMENLLQRALCKLMDQRTCLIIAHRLSTLNIVDRVLRVEGRTVREC